MTTDRRFLARDALHFPLDRGDVSDRVTVNRKNDVAVGEVAERRPAAFAHGFDQHTLLAFRKTGDGAIRGGQVAHAEFEIAVLVLLHLARQPWRSRPA